MSKSAHDAIVERKEQNYRVADRHYRVADRCCQSCKHQVFRHSGFCCSKFVYDGGLFMSVNRFSVCDLWEELEDQV